MALYDVLGDDGKTYQLEGPSGYTQEQMRDVLRQKNVGIPKPAKTEKPKEITEDEARLARLQRISDAQNYDSYDIFDEFEEFGKGIGRGAVNIGELAAKGVAEGLDADQETLDTISSVAESARSPFTQDAGPGGDTYVGGVLGEGLGSIIPLGAMALMGPLGWGAAGATAVAAGAGEAATRAREAGATEEEIDRTLLPGAGVGALELIPINRILGRAGTAIMEKAWKRYGKAFLEEGSTEGIAATAQNLIEQQIYNPDADLVNMDVIKEAGVGGGVGLIVQALADLALKGKRAGVSSNVPEDGVTETQATVDPTTPVTPDEPVTPPMTEADAETILAAANEVADDEVVIGEQTPEEAKAISAKLKEEERLRNEANRERIVADSKKQAEPKLTREQVIEKTLKENQIGSAAVIMPILEDELGRAGHDTRIKADEVMTVLTKIKQEAEAPKGTAQTPTQTPPEPQMDAVETPTAPVVEPTQEAPVEPTQEAPVEPTQEAPVEPTQEAPTSPPVEEQPTNPRKSIIDTALADSKAATAKGFVGSLQRKLRNSGQPLLTAEERLAVTGQFNQARGLVDETPVATPEDEGLGTSPSDMQSDTVGGSGGVNLDDTAQPSESNGGGLGPSDGVPSGLGRRTPRRNRTLAPRQPPRTKASLDATEKSIVERKREIAGGDLNEGKGGVQKKISVAKVLRDEAKLRKETMGTVGEQQVEAVNKRNEEVWAKYKKQRLEQEKLPAKQRSERMRAAIAADPYMDEEYTHLSEGDPLRVDDLERIVNLREGKKRPERGIKFKGSNKSAETVYDNARMFLTLKRRPIDSLILLGYAMSGNSVPAAAKDAYLWAQNNLSPSALETIDMVIGDTRRIERRGTAFAEKSFEESERRDAETAALAKQVRTENAKTKLAQSLELSRSTRGDVLGTLEFDPTQAQKTEALRDTRADTLDFTDDRAVREFLADIDSGESSYYASAARDNVYGSLNRALHPDVVKQLHNGNLALALNTLANTTTNPFVSRAATVLAEKMYASDTKVVITDNIASLIPGRGKDYRGRPIAGLYVVRNEPEFKGDFANTVIISADSTNALTLLHEVTHAVTFAEVASLESPSAKLLWKLYKQVKDDPILAGEYGVDAAPDPKRTKAQQDKDQFYEFIAEAFANPEFQRKLSNILADNKLTVWHKIANAVANIYRRAMGIPTKNLLDPSKVKLDQLIEAIMAPATNYSIRSVTSAPSSMASIADIARQSAKQISGRVYPDVTPGRVAKARAIIEKAAPAMRKVLLGIQPLNVLADMTKKWKSLHPVAKELNRLVRAQSGALSTVGDGLEATMKKVGNWMSKQNPDTLYAFKVLVAESTTAQIDPSLTRAQAEAKYRFKVGRNDKGQDVYAVDREKMDTWRAMQGVWQEMKRNGGAEIYTTMRDTYKGFFTAIQKQMRGHVDMLATNDKGEVDTKLADSLNKVFAELDYIEPYFPLERSGEFWVSFKSKDGRNEYVEAFNSDAEREAAIKQLKEEHNGEIDINSFDRFLKSQIKDFKRVPPSAFMQELKKILDNNKVKDSVKQEVSKLFLTSLPEQSFLKSFVRRKGTAGFNFDAFDVFNRRANSLARQLVHMEYGSKLMAVENRLRDLTGSNGKDDVKNDPAALQYVDRLINAAAFARSGTIPDWSKNTTMVAFHMTLGANMSAAFINLSQLPMVMAPYMSGEYGITNTTKAMGTAMKLFASSGTDRTVTTYGPDGKPVTRKAKGAWGLDNHDWDAMAAKMSRNGNAEGAQLAKDMKVLVEVAMAQGQLNRTSMQEVFDDTSFGSKMAKVNYISSLMFHQAERLNRHVGLAMGFQLETQRLREEAKRANREVTPEELRQAAEKAIDMVELTNGSAQAAAAPAWAQTGAGRIAFLFKKYGISMYYLLGMMMKNSVSSWNGKDAWMARRQFGMVMAGSGIIAGMQGLPFFGLIGMLHDLFWMEDDDDDWDTMIRKATNELAFNGLGNALTGADMGSRMGLSDLVFRDPYMDAEKSKIQVIVEQIGGPALSIAMGMERGIDKITSGDIGQVQRGVEQMLPAAIRNVIKGVRYADEGALTARRDPIVADFEPSEIIGQILGFAPSRYQLQSAINTRNARVQKNISQQSSRLRKQYFIALRMGDTYTARKIMEEIREYNRKHPYNAISADSMKKSIASHYKTSATMRGGVTVNPRMVSEILKSDREYGGDITVYDLF